MLVGELEVFNLLFVESFEPEELTLEPMKWLVLFLRILYPIRHLVDFAVLAFSRI